MPVENTTTPPVRASTLLELASSCFDGDIDAAGSRITAHAAAWGGGYVCLCNVHVLITALHDPSVFAAIDDAQLRLPDGAPVAWLLRALGSRRAERIGGPDVFARVMDRGRDQRLRHFFAGATETQLETLIGRVERLWPGVDVVGHHAPPYAPEPPVEGTVDRIAGSAAHVVWVGLGAPKQELWMARAARALPGVTFVGVGAAFDFVAGTKRRAPGWMQSAGLEWTFRMASEPRRLSGRYVRTNSEFVARAALELTRRRLSGS